MAIRNPYQSQQKLQTIPIPLLKLLITLQIRQKRLHLYQKKPFLPVRVLRLQPFLRRYRMPGWSKTVLMMSPRTRQMNLLRHLAPMWTVVWTNERKCTVVMSPLLMNTYLMIVPDSRERKILFLLSLTLVLNGMKPPMAPLQGP